MKNDSAYYRLAFKIFFDLSGIIAVPAILAAIIGKRLDAVNGTFPKNVIIALIVAFILSACLIVKKAKAYQKEFDRIT